LDTASELRTYGGHSGRVTGVAFAPSGDAVATASLDKSVQVWNAVTGQQLFTATAIDGWQSVAFAPSGREIVAGDRGGAMALWRAAGQEWSNAAQCVRRWQAHRGRVYDVTFSLSGHRIVSAAEDGMVTLWKRPPTLSLESVMPDDTKLGMTGIAQRGWLAIARQEEIQLWDVVRESPVANIGSESPCLTVAATADGRLLAAADRRGHVQLWDLECRGQQPVWSVRLPPESTYPLAFSPDGRLLAVSSHDESRIWIYDTASGRVQWELAVLHSFAPVFSPCGRYLAVPTQNDVLMWDVQSRQHLRSLLGHSSTVAAVAYSPDGRTIASASHDRLVKTWDTATGAELFSMAGHRSEVDAVAFSPDGRSLISADREGLVRIWHVGTGRPLLQIDGAPSPLGKLLMLPGGCELFDLIAERQGIHLGLGSDVDGR
jgi:WD40 repeat protein